MGRVRFRGRDWVRTTVHFWTGMLIQDKQNMLIQEHVLLDKITVTYTIDLTRLKGSTLGKKRRRMIGNNFSP